MPEYDMPLEEQVKLLVREFKSFKGSIETKLDSIDTRLTSVETKLTTVDVKVDKMQILLEDTNAIARLGLEGLQGLRESTDDKFAEAAKVSAGQTELLKSLFVHVRKRVERVERPKRRRER